MFFTIKCVSESLKFWMLIYTILFTDTTPEDYTDDFMNKLKDIDALSNQLKIFKTYLEIDSPVNFRNFEWAYQDISQAVLANFRNCSINPFGSTVTGLCFKNSDVDLYISGLKPPSKDSVQYLRRLAQVLRLSYNFINIRVIGNAKIPILKCVHRRTHISCDVNLKNMLGVCNSHLVKYYINLHQKIKDLTLVLKYWARVHKISGQNHLFTNYSLCLMVIFFFQRDAFKVPSVFRLQRDNRFFKPVEFWNGGFNPMHPYQTTIDALNRTSLVQLLFDFFDFYLTFPYGTRIICPYLGTSIDKEVFKKTETLPKQYSAYREYLKVESNSPLKMDSCICLQDPFEHSRNSTYVILNTVLERFVKFCDLGKKQCESGEKNFLYKLFTEDFQFQEISKEFNTFSIAKAVHAPQTDDNWFDIVTELLKIVLKDFLNFEIHDDGNVESVPAKSKRNENQKNVHHQLVFQLRCYGKCNVWDGRKNASKNLKAKEFTSFIEKEVAITDVLEKRCGFTLTANIIEFNLLAKLRFEPTRVEVSLTKLFSYRNTFKAFARFFSSNLKIWMQLYEKMLHEHGDTKQASGVGL